jgi:hypothetical protein
MFLKTIQDILIIMHLANYWSHLDPQTWNYVLCHITLAEQNQFPSLAMMDQYGALVVQRELVLEI